MHCPECLLKSVCTSASKKVKWSRYRPGVAQRVGRGIALLFHDRGTRRGLVVSSMPRPHFTSKKDPVPILQEAGWAPGPVWTGRKSRPHRDSIPDRPPSSQSLYWPSYPARIPLSVHTHKEVLNLFSWNPYWGILRKQSTCFTCYLLVDLAVLTTTLHETYVHICVYDQSHSCNVTNS